jgi:hypothetical protein
MLVDQLSTQFFIASLEYVHLILKIEDEPTSV